MRHFAFGLGLLTLGIATLPHQSASADQPMRVVATFSIVADLVQRIGGDAVELKTLVGPDQDTHAYEPTAEAQRAVAGADILVANGLGFEPWLDRLLLSSAFAGRLVVATEGITPLYAGAGSGGKEGAADPHAFQDPELVLAYIDNIAAGLSETDPAHAAIFRTNAVGLKRQFIALDAELQSTIGALPASRKHILTSHDAFGYLGRALGVQFIALQGVGDASEPSAKDLARIIAQVRAGAINAVFIENMNDPRFVENLAKDTGIRIGGTLYSDALSLPGGPAADLLSLFRHNQSELLRVLH